MIGTILVYRDDSIRPYCEIALGNGDRVHLALDAQGLVIERLAADGRGNETVFRAPSAVVAQICAGLVGSKSQSAAPPLRVLAAAVQRIGSAVAVQAAFTDAVASLG